MVLTAARTGFLRAAVNVARSNSSVKNTALARPRHLDERDPEPGTLQLLHRSMDVAIV